MPKVIRNTVTFNRDETAAFCDRWPCHGLPADFSATFHFDARGDLVGYQLRRPNGRTIAHGKHDGPALLALSEDARDAWRDMSRFA